LSTPVFYSSDCVIFSFQGRTNILLFREKSRKKFLVLQFFLQFFLDFSGKCQPESDKRIPEAAENMAEEELRRNFFGDL